LLMLRARETFYQAWCSLQVNCQQVQCLLLFKQIMDGIYLSIFQHIAAVDFEGHLVLKQCVLHIAQSSVAGAGQVKEENQGGNG